MKKLTVAHIMVFAFVSTVCKSQDTIRYPFRDGINISFAEAIRKIGNDWMYKDNGCSSGLFFVEISFEREIKEPRIFIPDNMPRKFADSIRTVFGKYLFIWDTSRMSKLTTSFIQPIYIDDLDCFQKESNSKSDLKNEYIRAYSIEVVSIQESIKRFFEKLGNTVEPRRYYILDLCIVRHPLKPMKWTK